MRSTLRLANTALLVSLASSCGTPDFETDLIPAGPPDVTLVNVASESAEEAATFCGADKRNLLYCPETGNVDPIVDSPPLGLFVRIAFDELLDPAIEVIDEESGSGSIAAADPVTLRCAGVDVAYDGFYQPSGSHLTYPPGPALVIEAAGSLAAGSSCTIELGDAIRDKSGTAVPAGSRGPFQFQLAPLVVVATNPQDMTEGIDADAVLAVSFNNSIDEASLAGLVAVTDGGGAVAVTVALDPEAPEVVSISPAAGTFALETSYTVTLSSGILDVGGASFEPEGGSFSFSFTTGP